MPAGRPPIPISELKIRGTFRPDRHSAAPALPAGLPKPPRKLTAEERKVWSMYLRLWGVRGTLTPGDGPALLQLVEVEVEKNKLAVEIEAAGRTYDTRDEAGNTIHRAHPLVAQFERARRHWTQMLREFGGTPSSVTKVRQQKAPKKNVWSELATGS